MLAIVLIVSIIGTTIHINLIIGDIRKTTSQLTIDDVRTFMKIIERQQNIQTKEQMMQGNCFVTRSWDSTSDNAEYGELDFTWCDNTTKIRYRVK